MENLIQSSWQLYRKFQDAEFLVKPSIPILFFGDSKAFLQSETRVITVGLNPSKNEFPEHDRFLRFRSAQGLNPSIQDEHFIREYTGALNGYFQHSPYKRWFNSFEPMLRGMGCSYYPGAKNIAIHTDLCSPLATDPTWRGLPKTFQEKLITDGVEVWHNLVEYLCPHVIIVSVAAQHLERIRFTRLEGWRVFFTVQRQNPYTVKLMKVRINERQAATVVFGKAAHIPFGTVSNHDKEKIGQALRGHLDGK